MIRTPEQWVGVYEDRKAFFLHDNNPNRPHPKLSAGDHSNGFANSDFVIEDPEILDQAAADLVELLVATGFDLDSVDRVVGPAMGAITLASFVALHIGVKRGRSCLCGYAEKDPADPAQKALLFNRTQIAPGDRILSVEDVLTTGDSVERMGALIAGKGGIVLPAVLSLVNRSGLTKVGTNRVIVSLIDKHMPKYPPADCPLCKMGSTALSPKGENWGLLTAVYSERSGDGHI